MTDASDPPPPAWYEAFKSLASQQRELRNEVEQLRQKLDAEQKQTASLNEQLQAQHAWLTALQGVVDVSPEILPIVVGVLTAGRFGHGGKDWLESAKLNALVQLPNRANPDSPEAIAAALIVDLFDRIEIGSRVAEGGQGLN